eukprot:m.6836 g.6836  ORF g.6836 m.6836 type:complete len:1419 (+) comp3592_c0_seq2:225-4481(+)
MRKSTLVCILGTLFIATDAVGDTLAPSFNRCRDRGPATNVPRRQEKTLVLDATPGTNTRSYTMNWDATDDVDGGIVGGTATYVVQVGTFSVEQNVTDQAGNTVICQLTITVLDKQEPQILCPENVSLIAYLPSQSNSLTPVAQLRDLDSECDYIVKDLNSMPNNVTPGECKVYAADNDAIKSIESVGDSSYTVGTHPIKFIVTDNEANKNECDVSLVVQSDPEAIRIKEAVFTIKESTNFAMRPLGSNDLDGDSRTSFIEKMIESLGTLYLLDADAKGQYLSSQYLEELGFGLRRLAQQQPWATSLNLLDRKRLMDAIVLLLDHRRADFADEMFLRSQSVCGDDICEMKHAESCQTCPQDCGMCEHQAHLSYNGDYVYTSGDQAQSTSPFKIVTSWAPLPIGFGPVSIFVEMYKFPLPNEQATLDVRGLSRQDTSFIDPTQTAPSGFAFLGVTFVVKRISETFLAPLQLQATIDLSSIGRWIVPQTEISLWYYSTGDRQWKICSRANVLNSATKTLTVILDTCADEQLALFYDLTKSALPSLEENAMTVTDDAIRVNAEEQAVNDKDVSSLQEKALQVLKELAGLSTFLSPPEEVPISLYTTSFSLATNKKYFGMLSEYELPLLKRGNQEEKELYVRFPKDLDWSSVASVEGSTPPPVTRTTMTFTTTEPQKGECLDCQLDIGKAYSGFWQGEAGKNRITNVENETACCLLCGQEDKCSYWTYANESDPFSAQICILHTVLQSVDTQTFRTSGQRPNTVCNVTTPLTTTITTTTKAPAFTDRDTAVLLVASIPNWWNVPLNNSDLIGGHVAYIQMLEDPRKLSSFGRAIDVNIMSDSVLLVGFPPSQVRSNFFGNDDTCWSVGETPTLQNVTNNTSTSYPGLRYIGKAGRSAFQDTVCDVSSFGFFAAYSEPFTSSTTSTSSSKTSITSTTSSETSTTVTKTSTSATLTTTSTVVIYELPASQKSERFRLHGSLLIGMLGFLILFCIVSCYEHTLFQTTFVKLEEARDVASTIPPEEVGEIPHDLQARPLTDTWAAFWIFRWIIYSTRNCFSRHALCTILMPTKACCFPCCYKPKSYPKRLLAVMYFFSSACVALAVISVQVIAENENHLNYLPRPNDNDRESFDESGYFKTRDIGRIESVPVEGIYHGLWAVVFTTPIMLLMALCLGKFYMYKNLLRLSGPRRFRATISRARRVMNRRGLPVETWITEAKFPERKGFEMKTATDNNTFVASAPEGVSGEALPDGGYLEILESKIDKDEALGWGSDSVMGDEVAVSGAGEAMALDDDSLFDLDEFNDPLRHDLAAYKEEFTSYNQGLVRTARWWWSASSMLFVFFTFCGILGPLLVYSNNVSHGVTKFELRIIITAMSTFGIIFVLVLSPVVLCVYGAWQACQPEPHPDGSNLRTPSCENTLCGVSFC